MCLFKINNDYKKFYNFFNYENKKDENFVVSRGDIYYYVSTSSYKCIDGIDLKLKFYLEMIGYFFEQILVNKTNEEMYCNFFEKYENYRFCNLKNIKQDKSIYYEFNFDTFDELFLFYLCFKTYINTDKNSLLFCKKIFKFLFINKFLPHVFYSGYFKGSSKESDDVGNNLDFKKITTSYVKDKILTLFISEQCDGVGFNWQKDFIESEISFKEIKEKILFLYHKCQGNKN